MIQLNVTGKHGRASIFCDSYLAMHDEKSDVVKLTAYRDCNLVHTTTVTRDGQDVLVQLRYLQSDVADSYNTTFQLKSLFPRKKAEAPAA